MKIYTTALILSITAIILEFYAIYDVFARPTSQRMMIFVIVGMTILITIQLRSIVSMTYQYFRNGMIQNG